MRLGREAVPNGRTAESDHLSHWRCAALAVVKVVEPCATGIQEAKEQYMSSGREI